MKFFKRHIFVLLLIILSAGCQSVVRFSSDSKSGTVSNSRKRSEPKTKPVEGSLTKDKDYLDKYKRLEPLKLNIIREAESWIGTPYKLGGTTKSGADCSGYVQSVYDFCGVALPRTAQQQFNYTARVDYNELEPGDLIFFGHSGNISHVGIFGGSGYMFHASSSSGVVRQAIQEYFEYQNVEGYGRPTFK